METGRNRLAARIRVNHDFDPFEGVIESFVTDLSRTGAFVRTRTKMTVGSRVDLYFTLLQAEMECVEGVGEVVRVQDDPPGVGVCFVELTPASRALIDRVLAAP